jgi:hypothetical protein
MMTCIYEVRYEFRWHSSEPTHWEFQSVKVAAGADATEAVEKARQAALSLHRFDENGREERCSSFRLKEVVLIAEAEL